MTRSRRTTGFQFGLRQDFSRIQNEYARMPVAPPTPPMSDITVMMDVFGNVGTTVSAATCWALSPWKTEIASAMMPKNMMIPKPIIAFSTRP